MGALIVGAERLADVEAEFVQELVEVGDADPHAPVERRGTLCAMMKFST